MKVDVRRSIQIHDQLRDLDRWKDAMDRKWHNAVYVVLNMMSGEVYYVEGLIEVDDQIITHAWIEEDGKIIEPALSIAPEDLPKYKPVARLSRSVLRHKLSEAGDNLSLPFTVFENLEET